MGVSDEERLIEIADALARQSTGALTPGQQVFMRVWELEMEVNDGGFELYFSNTPGREAPRAGAALRTIGADQCADLVEQAVRIFDQKGLDWGDDVQRRSRLENVIDEAEAMLDDLDGKFYGYPDPLSVLLTAFVAKHPGEF